jgi:phage host-nuclease inhibitor protein Gam
MNRIKEETYSEICELYKNSIKEMSKEINDLKKKLQEVQEKNDELTYKLINNKIEYQYK